MMHTTICFTFLWVKSVAWKEWFIVFVIRLVFNVYVVYSIHIILHQQLAVKKYLHDMKFSWQ